jgi:hypothetical protein
LHLPYAARACGGKELDVLSLLGLLMTTVLAAFYCWWVAVHEPDD